MLERTDLGDLRYRRTAGADFRERYVGAIIEPVVADLRIVLSAEVIVEDLVIVVRVNPVDSVRMKTAEARIGEYGEKRAQAQETSLPKERHAVRPQFRYRTPRQQDDPA